MSATPHSLETTAQTREGVLATIAQLLDDVIGDEYDLGVEVTMETSFADDIELESIEFVRLGELLQEHFGDRVDFVRWFSGLDVDAIIELTVGELVEFVHGEIGTDGA